MRHGFRFAFFVAVPLGACSSSLDVDGIGQNSGDWDGGQAGSTTSPEPIRPQDGEQSTDVQPTGRPDSSTQDPNPGDTDEFDSSVSPEGSAGAGGSGAARDSGSDRDARTSDAQGAADAVSRPDAGGTGGAGTSGSVGGQIPSEIMLWCLADRRIPRADFRKYADHYVETGGTQEIFSVAKGDFDLRNDGITKECRVEAYDINKWAPGSTWHSFEADFKVATRSSEEMCFIQFKNNVTENPQIMCHFKGGKITCSPRGKGPVSLGAASTNYNDESFKLKIRSNGNEQEVYFNDVKANLGDGSTPAQTGPTVRNYFRWGIYMNYPASADYVVTVSNIHHN